MTKPPNWGRHGGWTRALAVVAVTMALVLVAGQAPATAATPPPVSRSPSPDYTVTLAARVCPDYTDIMANRARNDIQESLKDLGKDTVYSAGQPIDPAIEQTNDPNCTPLNGAVFSFGDNYTKPSPTDYSQVTVSDPGSAATTAATHNGVAELDVQGNPTGRTLNGAVTYTLNATQISLATRSNAFWVQGGTQNAPLPVSGGQTLAFGALRCAIDNLNGDNVEWIGYPNTSDGSARHVFCYAYYIATAPPQGSITIVKQLSAGSGAITHTFSFASNATYEPSGVFSLTVSNGQPDQTTFVRAISASFGGPYTFAEDLTDLRANGWELTGLSCTGGSDVTTNLAGGTVSVNLQADEDVVCTYTDRPPADPGLVVRKVTIGGTGTFPISVTSDNGAGPFNGSVTTTAPDQPATATGIPNAVPPGTYTITETLPAPTAAGSWEVVDAYCSGGSKTPRAAGTDVTIDVTLAVNGSADCTFVNRFVPGGSIVLNLITEGGTATGAFVVGRAPVQPRATAPTGDTGAPPVEQRFKQEATTTAPGTPVLATPVTPEDATDSLPLGLYAALTLPPATTNAGTWDFLSFTCTEDSPPPTTFADGAIGFELNDANPDANCTAVYRLVPPSTLEVVKTVSGPDAARPDDAWVEVSCDNDAFGRVVAPTGDAGPFRLPAPGPLQFQGPSTCRLTEPSNGASGDADFSVTAELTAPGQDAQTVSVPGTFDISAPDTDYTLTVHDVYALAPVVPPAPPELAATGAHDTVGIGLACLALVAVGAALVVAGRRRPRARS